MLIAKQVALCPAGRVVVIITTLTGGRSEVTKSSTLGEEDVIN